MEFCIPWENWIVENIQYGLSQTNTRIDNGLFVPIYYADRSVRCQAFHILSLPLSISEKIEATNLGTFLVINIDKDCEFGKKLKEFELRNMAHATHNKSLWWPSNSSKAMTYKTALTTLASGNLEWRIQIPDSGIFSCYDTLRKSWFASNEPGLANRKFKILARTSGLWVDQSGFGMEWKLIGTFVM
jgi:hypothetical protein